MAIITVPLADRSHSAIHQIRLTAPDMLLEDGRIIHFLSKLTTCCTGARCAWELVFTSVPAPTGATLEARLITHASVAASQRSILPELSGNLQQKLLDALEENEIAAEAADDPLPALTDKAFIPLCKQGCGLISEDAALTPGHLRQHLCTRPGNGVSLLLVLSAWQEGELAACADCMSTQQQAMLAREPVFDFVVTVWGPDSRANAAWLQELTLSRLAPCTPKSAVSYAPCLRRDPWRLMTLLPPAQPRPTLLSLMELLTVCGCPTEPGEMQRMCRMNWRDRATEALRESNMALLPMDMPLTEDDLQFMGLKSDEDLENVLHMDAQMADMLRMCVAILRKLNTMGDAPVEQATTQMDYRLGLLLPTVGHIYEQFVRECCYQTMYCPYITYATGRQPAQVVKVFLSTYDLGPGVRGYRLRKMPEGATEPAMQSIIREQMIDDFRDHTLIGGRKGTDDWWYALFNDMTTARTQRNGLTHERANLRSAQAFAKAFLREDAKRPSLLRRLLMCRQVTTNFPAFRMP